MCGVSDVSGSWKIIEMRAPRISLSCLRSSPFISTPSNRIDPSTLPLAAVRPIAASTVWLLPEPLSPTRPRHSPGATLNDSFFTASTSPSCVWKDTERSRTSRMGFAPTGADAEGVAVVGVDKLVLTIACALRCPRRRGLTRSHREARRQRPARRPPRPSKPSGVDARRPAIASDSPGSAHGSRTRW